MAFNEMTWSWANLIAIECHAMPFVERSMCFHPTLHISFYCMSMCVGLILILIRVELNLIWIETELELQHRYYPFNPFKITFLEGLRV